MEDFDQRTERVFRPSLPPAIFVVNYRGRVTVKGWEHPQVRMAAIRRGEDAFGRPDGSWVLGILAEEKGPLLSLRTRLSDVPGVARGTIPRGMDLDLRAPWHSAICVQSPSGLVVIEDISGAVYGRIRSGHISLRRVAGHIVVISESGSVAGDWLHGHMAARLSTGSLQVRESTFSFLSAETGTGNIEARVAVNPSDSYSLRSQSGNIDLELTPSSEAMLELRCDGGQIECALPGQTLESRPGYRRVQLGEGHARVSARSTRGDVRVRSWLWEGAPNLPPLPGQADLPQLPAGAPPEMAVLLRAARAEVSSPSALAELAGLPPAW